MAFVAEDGTGLATATSLVSVATTDTYWADRGGADNTTWVAATTASKQAALIKATDYVRHARRYRWLGTRKSYAQTMPWPRTGVTERDGLAVADTIVPWQVQQAVASLAVRALTEDLLPDLERGGHITSETVGPLSVTYGDGAPLGSVIQRVDGLVAPLLRLPLIEASPYLKQPTIPAGYVEKEFTYS